MGRDARNAQRREAEWLAKQATQRCPVCGKRFAKRTPGEMCSIACKQKAEAKATDASDDLR